MGGIEAGVLIEGAVFALFWLALGLALLAGGVMLRLTLDQAPPPGSAGPWPPPAPFVGSPVHASNGPAASYGEIAAILAPATPSEIERRFRDAFATMAPSRRERMLATTMRRLGSGDRIAAMRHLLDERDRTP
jgi:hypothetical protein